MGTIRKSYLAVCAFFAFASVVLLGVGIGLTDWQRVYNPINTNSEVRRFGLWGYKSCVGLEPPCSSSRSKLIKYKSCETIDGPHCEQNRKALKIAQVGLMVEICVTFLFMIYCLVKINSRFKKFAETGCCGWCILPLPLLGAIVGAICWGLYIHYNPYRGESYVKWGVCVWLTLAGWICGVLGWVPRLVYRLK